MTTRDPTTCPAAATAPEDRPRPSRQDDSQWVPRGRQRIVMAVHNAGSSDVRVVRAAEAACRAGFDCHVVGVQKPGLAAQEVIDGVTYHRVAMPSGLQCLIAGLWPRRGVFWALQHEGRRQGLKYLADANHAAKILWACLVKILIRMPLLLLAGRADPRQARRRVAELRDGTRARLANRPRLSAALRTGLFGLRGLAGSRAPAPPRPINADPYLARTIRLPTRLRQGRLGVRFQRGRYLCALYETLTALKAQVYHAHELWTLEACALAAESVGARLVYDSHELEAHRNAPWSRRVRREWVRHETRYIGRADEVIAVSDGCAEALRGADGLPRVTVLRNTPSRRFHCAPTDLRTALGLGPEVPLIIYVGAVTFNRGLDVAVRALPHLPGHVLATLGPWREQTRRDLESLAASLGVADRFRMHPKVLPGQVVPFIAGADVSLVPIQNACLSYYHCLPNKVFESAFAGVPMVASDFPELRRFVLDNAVGEVCDETDPEAVARAVRKVYAARRRYYTPEKIERLRQTCCFEKESEKLIALYDRLLRPEAGASPPAGLP